MALNPKKLQKIMQSNLNAKGIKGKKIKDFTTALSEGLIEAFLKFNETYTADVGLLPAGAPGFGLGKLSGLNDSLLSQQIMSLMRKEKIIGNKMKIFIDAISNSIVVYFILDSISNSTHPTVVLGTGVGKVKLINKPKPLIPVHVEFTNIILKKMKSKKMSGDKLKSLIKSISEGFCKHMMALSIVTVSVTGAPMLVLGSPVPSGGAGMGRIS